MTWNLTKFFASVSIAMSATFIGCEGANDPDSNPRPPAGTAASTSEAQPPADPTKPVAAIEADGTKQAEERDLGNRGKIFARYPSATPDPDWRSVLNPWLADANPRWSQALEELVIRDYFRDVKGGFYLDIGCADPHIHSTTHFLEKFLHWRGIGVDVNDAFAPRWDKLRPESEFVCNAIYENDGEELTLHVGGGFRSIERDVVESMSNPAAEIREVTVTTVSMNTLLEERGIEKVDFVNLDIEGAEMGALRGFDVAKYRPDLLCIESRQLDELNAYFKPLGYAMIEKYRKVDKINYYFAPVNGVTPVAESDALDAAEREVDPE